MAAERARSFDIVPLNREHLEALWRHVPEEARGALESARGIVGRYAGAGDAWCALQDGAPVAAAGFIEMWPGRATAWAVFGPVDKRYWLRMTRAAARGVARAGTRWRRIEAYVDAGFPEGCLWARMLGFAPESRMAAFSPQGRDALMYVKLTPDAATGETP